MTFLPIQFWTKFKKADFGELDSSEILNLIQDYLDETGFNYVKRKENKIAFHKADGWSSFNVKSFLHSGVVKIKSNNGDLTIINGNWMVFLIAIPFIIGILAADSKFSTLDTNDVDMIWYAFYWIFGGNLFIRIIAHFAFKSAIEELVRKNYTQHNL
ncbi:hypothetical protein FF125_06910 [Aureibaculum algae]|uniref:Uncharacterized protein n=1 Tax=Aureibaculum algae TaxID=2584122 RepID=A0A5B7TU77_9FLAO|nr:hypothetical protein [Aureibaculum algae]QCX38172.1 hypothetical protein FF125_06910 [Aureibaculum algae]